MLVKLNFCSCSSLVAATCVCSSTPWSISSLSVFLDVRITKIPRGNVHQDAIRCGLVDLASLGRRTAQSILVVRRAVFFRGLQRRLTHDGSRKNPQFLVTMYFSSTKVLIGDTILLMETGPPFYIVIRAARRSSRLQAKEVPLFLSCFKPLTVPEYWSGPPESNQRPCSAVRCSTGLAHPLHPLLSFSPSDRCFLPD